MIKVRNEKPVLYEEEAKMGYFGEENVSDNI